MPSRDDHLSEVQGWEEGTCQDCGLPFPRRQHYESRCPLCYKVDRQYKVLWGDQAFLWAQEKVLGLQQELQAARKALREAEASTSKTRSSVGELKGGLLKQVIILCHPDKHNGSESATKVTQALLALRKNEPRRRRK